MRILLLRQNITDPIALQNGITAVKNYASTVGLTLDFTQVDTTKQFTSVPFYNAPNSEGYVSGVQITPQEVFDEAKRLGYIFSPENIACIVFDSSKIIPSPTNPIDNGICIQIPMNWYGAYPEVFAEFFLHEICHYSATLNNIPDLTHKQFDPMWNHQFDQKSNIDYYLFLLKPFVKPQDALGSVILTRTSDDGIQTLGRLETPNFKCFTLERPWKNNAPNISCVPKGTYICKYTFSPLFLRYTYQLQNVKGRSGIRIHSANFYSQLLGCIALGNSFRDINWDGEIDVLNSRVTVLKFETLMQKKPFILKII